MQYKVLTQKDRFFAGKFDPQKLEQGINAYAEEGWRVVSMPTATIPGFGNNREELVALMERERTDVEIRYGVSGTVFDDVFFTEKAIVDGRSCGRLSVEV